MPPLDRRRRRSYVPMVASGVVAAIVLALLIGGILKVPAASGPYRRAVNRSFAAQTSVVVAASNRDGARLEALMANAPGMDRVALQEELATLVAGTAAQAATARTMAPPQPTGGTDQAIVGVMDARARATAQVRSAVEGVLGMAPTGGVVPASAPAGAAAGLTAAGRLLVQSDHDYAATRHGFASAPGNPSLPRSVWVPDPGLWTPGPVQTLVGEITGSQTLAPVYRVVLIPNALGVHPGALPAPGGSARSVAVLPPTTSLAVTAVVANQGNVPVGGVRVSVRATPNGRGAAVSSSQAVDLEAGTSAAVTLPPLKVVPGTTYTVVVSVRQPPAQTDRTAGSTVFTARIAPLPPPLPTPATTTTTTAKPTTTTRPRSGAPRSGAAARAPAAPAS